MNTILIQSVRGTEVVPIDSVLLSNQGHGKVFITGNITSDLCDDVIKQLMYLANNDEVNDIICFIDSPGGEVRSGLALYDVIRFISEIKPITTICLGRAASMGAVLLCAADKRLALPHSQIMIHDASFSNADFSGMKPDEISEKSKDLLKTTTILRKIITERTGQKAKTVEDRMKKDSYFESDEAVSFGLLTNVIESISEVIA